MTPSITIPERMTTEEFLKFPFPEGTRWELYGGRPVQMIFDEKNEMSAPTLEHQAVVSCIAFAWNGLDPHRKSGVVLVGPIDLELSPGELFQPDVVRLPATVEISGQRISVAPIAVAEVLSPSTASHDITEKYQAYRKAGVKEYWIVDPRSCELFLHVLNGTRYIRQNPDEEGFCVSPQFDCKVRIVRQSASFVVETRPIK